ncbi:hypothetical protein BOX15_Mlig002392g6 [Macrostomum lignano]|uniref:Uncharacterized protein n=1 Tax=Macrostomum lignano TaxID=282301 RepID=A0A267E3X8_9PLAT|nr:hypothetical protein BOX15_Mlig002392g6 [Macrostomum lignano]
MDAFQLLDFLPAWESFRAEVKNSDVVSRHALNTAILNEDVYLFTLDKDGDLSVRIFVSPNFLIRAFKLHTPISVRDLLGFQPTLKRWSQLDAVVVWCKNSDANPQREVEAFVSRISDDIDSDSDLDPSLQFLIRQLSLTLVNRNNRCYDISLVRQSALLYLISSSAYSYLRKLLPLPHPRTLQLQLAGTGEVGTETDAADVIQSVFASLSGAQRTCVIMFDEMYIQPSVRYRCRHLLGRAVDDPDQVARTILAIMVKPLLGGKPFVVRLLPTYILSAEFLQKCISQCIKAINNNGGRVIALISDNHPPTASVLLYLAMEERSHGLERMLHRSRNSSCCSISFTLSNAFATIGKWKRMEF